MEMCAGIRSPRPGSSMPSPFSGAICRTQPKSRIRSANVRQFWRGMRISYRNGSIPLNQDFPSLARCTLDRSFCYDKPIPEEVIGEPVGVALAEREIGNNPRCFACEAKGAILCRTCSGSGLYIDSVLESQGILVKVRCLGCGGTGNIMCSQCGGRGHV
ncbi:uncharacterized protein LOC116263830 [Nymphaea colorata]|nr:uncharacterized protein LOC116263830 [Nymphaea colorata]